MKKIYTFILISFALIAKGDSWIQKASFPGSERTSSFSFSLGNKGYVGAGWHSSFTLQDFWEYDPSTDAWTQKADFGGGFRHSASAFGVQGKGYAGLGFYYIGSAFNPMKTDIWQYDPLLNTWTQKSDFAGGQRMGASSFVMDNKGYITCGIDYSNPNYPPVYRDLWEYDPAADSWTEKAHIPSHFRANAEAFAIGNKAYINGGNGFSDFWEYDLASDTWTMKANFPFTNPPYSGGRSDGASFAIGNKGYFVAGVAVSTPYNDLYEYDPASDLWTLKTSLPADVRIGPAGFSIGNKGYVSMGYYNVGTNGQIFLSDLWEYTPDGSTGINEMETSNFNPGLYPNPASNFIFITPGLSSDKKIEISIYNTEGKKVYDAIMLPQKTNEILRINIASFSPGIYLVKAGNSMHKFLKAN